MDLTDRLSKSIRELDSLRVGMYQLDPNAMIKTEASYPASTNLTCGYRPHARNISGFGLSRGDTQDLVEEQ